jgi:hypothetical protein
VVVFERSKRFVVVNGRALAPFPAVPLGFEVIKGKKRFEEVAEDEDKTGM